MTEDLEEIKERLENVEQYVNLMERRIDVLDTVIGLRAAGREPSAPSSPDNVRLIATVAEDATPDDRDLELKEVDHMFRTIVIRQGMHSTSLREAVRGRDRVEVGMRSVTGTLNSIQRMLEDCQGRRTLTPRRSRRPRMSVPASTLLVLARAIGE